jgi:hypothetical protein
VAETGIPPSNLHPAKGEANPGLAQERVAGASPAVACIELTHRTRIPGEWLRGHLNRGAPV